MSTPTACTNCGATLDPARTSQALDKSGKHEFCPQCSGIGEALGIGLRQPAFLYESGSNAISWMGAIMGAIVHKTIPTRRRFSTARFRVRMLDGSLWCGTGPSSNGTYIRLRPMKGQ